MVEIKLEELSKSDFYSNTQLFRNLSESNEDENDKIVSIDDEYYMDLNIDNIDTFDNFIKIMNIINYWNPDKIPDILYIYLFNIPIPIRDLHILKYSIPPLSEDDIEGMIQMIKDSFGDENTLKKEALLIIEYRLKGIYMSNSEYLYAEVISNKYLSLLTFIFKNQIGIEFYEYENFIGKSNFLNILMEKSNGNEEEIIDYMLKNGCHDIYFIVCDSIRYSSSILKIYHKNGFQLTKDMCDESCSYFNLECLQYAITNGCDYDKERLKYLLKCYYHRKQREYYSDYSFNYESFFSEYIIFEKYVDSLE